uniref:NADH dehydrogenase subunit 1 n=1 Tax=Periclimenes brevicarpalis TaxID=390963 RepID=UPI001FA74689|nr:NADH dehydrogenase subunit 1 [Periclimenes brevicarpalis]UMY76331.1 NADH dehydrogenase subunit 1 [Periclimenes brevicarpalis]
MLVVIKLINYLVLIIFVLVSVAFLTLMERKILGYIQCRKGPNVVGYYGVLQPFADAVKLFCKEQVHPTMSNFLPYYLSPVMSLFLSLICWCCFPYGNGFFDLELGALFFLCCTSAGVYPVLSSGWASNSKYSLLGSLRSVAQTISYEVSLALILISMLVLVGGFNLVHFDSYQRHTWFLFLGFPLAVLWFASSLAESNRTPFDLAEGESELVSGFNTEYSGGGFALIFMAEYASILFLSGLFCIIFLGGVGVVTFFKLVFISFCFVWVRGTLPRFRYDKLMYLAWKSFLPVALNYCLFMVCMRVLLEVYLY